MTHTHNTDQMFRDAAKQYREKPPENAWAVIDSAINRGKRKKAFILIASAAAVVILLLGFGAGYLYRSVSEKAPEYVNLMQQDELDVPVAIETNISIPSESTHKAIQTLQHEITPQIVEKNVSDNEKTEQTAPVEVIDSVLKDDEIQNDEEVVSELQVEMTQAEKDFQLEQLLTNMPDSDVSSLPIAPGETYYYEDMPAKPEIFGSKWSVGGDVAAAYAFRNMPSQDMEYKDRSPIADEQGVSSWNAGVYATNEIAGAVRIKTGLTWASYGQGSQNIYAYQEGPSFSVNSSSGSVNTSIYTAKESAKPLSNNSLISDPDGLMLDNSELFAGQGLSDPNLMLVQRFDYLEIPFMVQVSTKRDKGLSFVTEAGIYAGILTGNRAFLDNTDESYLVGYTENLRPLSFGAVAGAGAKYAISKFISAEIVPEFRYSFFSISKIPEIQYHPYQFGLGIGLTYHF